MFQKYKFTKDYLKEMIFLLEKIDSKSIDRIANILWDAYLKNRMIFLIGNGGSASISSHLAADLSKNTLASHWNDKEKRFKAISMTDNVPWMTAVGNDQSHENIFVEQLKNFASAGDVLFVISGSGNSPNIVKAAIWARDKGLTIIGMLGFEGGYVKDFLDDFILVPSDDYGLIESAHTFIHHSLAANMMARMRTNRK